MRCRVFITPHALKQYRKRVDPNVNIEKLNRWVAAKIHAQMTKGLTRNNKGAYNIEMRQGLVAIIDFNRRGPGWAVLTFITVSKRLRLPG